MATINKLNRVRETKEALKTVLNEHGGNITDETVFREYPVIAQQLLESGWGGGGSAVLQEKTITENGVYTPDEGFDGFSKVAVNVESGASGDLPTLFAPSIKFSASNGMLAITDGGNGNFAVKYALYADEVYQGETAEKSIKITDFIQPTETQTIIIKMLAKSSNFNNSAFSNSVKWDYIAVSSGTVGLAYTLSSDGSYYSCSGIGTATETDIEIGTSIDGIAVTEISRQAFLNCTSLTSVKIPSSITKIAFNAFGGCTGLKSVVIPDSVTYLDSMLFMNCAGLESAVIPNSLERLPEYTFSGCTNLKSINIPSRVKSIGENAFSSCISLKTINFPDGLTTIDKSTFYGCAGLESIVIPDSVTTIKDNGFYGCTGLKSVVIPDSVTTFGTNVFYQCAGLESVTLSNNITSNLAYVFYKCTNLKSVNIPNNVTSLGVSAFGDCTSLESIVIPNNVTSFGINVFYRCTALKSIAIPDSVNSIGNNSFNRCSNLKRVDFSNHASIPTLGSTVFENTNADLQIKVPATLIDEWKSATNWSEYADKIVTEFTNEV